MGADNIACRAIFEQFGPQKCMVGPHILQPGCFERQRKVAQSARWGYATTPKIPHRTFLRNGFEDIVCGIHPRELLRIEILPILILVSLVRSFLPMPLQVLVGECVGYSALFLRTIEGKPTCPQYHKTRFIEKFLVNVMPL